ncbi:MerR family transcriptional regulator [Desulfobacter curvatus]|uniref:MerR family transcriptional regulator n=1 Tax=Desulfobacter curvatus TaxID=2290 RepID=UPI00037DDA52|nr:MerR family transcriptional regulator [Desulfobacter curvatus]
MMGVSSRWHRPGEYTKKKVAEVTGITTQAVTHYTNEGLIEPGIEDSRGRGTAKIYSKENLLEFLIINEFKQCGFSLSIIKNIMKSLRRRQDKWLSEIVSSEPTKTNSPLRDNHWLSVFNPVSEEPTVEVNKNAIDCTSGVNTNKHKMVVSIDVSEAVKKIQEKIT